MKEEWGLKYNPSSFCPQTSKYCPKNAQILREIYKSFYEGKDVKIRIYFSSCSLAFLRKGGMFMAKLEREFQPKLIKEIETIFPGCIVCKNESYIQGFPDLTIYYGKKWACLETKRAENAERQPNQPFYVTRLNYMSFARFVSPENKEIVLGELRAFFEK